MGDHLPGLGQCDPYTMPGSHHARCARVAPSSATTPSGNRVPEVWVGGSYPAPGDLVGLPGVPVEAGASKASYPHTHCGVLTSQEVGANDPCPFTRASRARPLRLGSQGQGSRLASHVPCATTNSQQSRAAWPALYLLPTCRAGPPLNSMRSSYAASHSSHSAPRSRVVSAASPSDF